MKTYNAPWGKTLIVASILVTVLCVGASVMSLGFLDHFMPPAVKAASLLPIAILAGGSGGFCCSTERAAGSRPCG
jgi:hypothetical protein